MASHLPEWNLTSLAWATLAWTTLAEAVRPTGVEIWVLPQGLGTCCSRREASPSHSLTAGSSFSVGRSSNATPWKSVSLALHLK